MKETATIFGINGLYGDFKFKLYLHSINLKDSRNCCFPERHLLYTSLALEKLGGWKGSRPANGSQFGSAV